MKVSTVQVIGIGKKGRGDDAVGICLARLLRERLPPEVEVLEEEGEALRLMEDWKRRELVILIDAVEAGYDLGTLHRFQFPGDDIPTNLFRFSAHAFGVAQAIELGRVLGKLPKKLVLYGIEGKCFEANKALSREVEKALPNALSRICKEITQLIPSGD